MATEKMHENEVLADPDLVRRLLSAQMPQWANLPICSAPLGGTDNALYRLGEDKVVRLPRIDWAVPAREKEHEWLPKLSPLLPFEIPSPLAMGSPGEGYPWPWSVYRWLEGEDPSIHLEIDRDALLPDLVLFIKAMREISPIAAPDSRSGLPLQTVDESTRAAIDILGKRVDQNAVLTLWEASLAAPSWDHDPQWVHGDLDARNLLVKDGRLNAVIGWGSAGVGDPGYDISVAWKVLSPDARRDFRSELKVDDATWTRARGWTLCTAVNALSYYTLKTNPLLVQETQKWIAAVLADGR